MSLLTAFAAAASSQAGAIIGTEPITIGTGAAVSAVLGEVTNERDFTDIGHDQDQTLSAVVRVADWAAAGYSMSGAQYVGKVATARSLRFRVVTIHVGQAFVNLSLGDTGKS
jgi:hypothetical protein